MSSTILCEPHPTDPDFVLMIETWRVDDPDCPPHFLKFAEARAAETGRKAKTVAYRHFVPKSYPAARQQSPDGF